MASSAVSTVVPLQERGNILRQRRKAPPKSSYAMGGGKETFLTSGDGTAASKPTTALVNKPEPPAPTTDILAPTPTYVRVSGLLDPADHEQIALLLPPDSRIVPSENPHTLMVECQSNMDAQHLVSQYDHLELNQSICGFQIVQKRPVANSFHHLWTDPSAVTPATAETILLEDSSTKQNTEMSICERFARWVLSIE